ncbi:heat-shock protein Hsp90 [Megasphaera paucivorans]|uniref:Molecular chaperone Hsp90 n=1 Tax=Megasphaera paucivorans TaxID=349095 RepID=A0A1G9RNC8_9FIRM|nr:molecular chaperone Hsp90 [Megasphaera paucivorans]SDM24467.1 hypothetical protein SAMN05660299_00511 [Megasphaera paucivorans]
MENETRKFIIEKTQELISAPSCSREAKEAAQHWLETVGSEQETEVTKKYLLELESDIMPIDMLIAFAESSKGIEIFGTEKAAAILTHAKQIKSAGAQYCDCPACTAAAAILEKKNLFF